MLTLSRRYREHSLQPLSLEMTGDYTAQINEDDSGISEAAVPRDFSSKKCFLRTFTLPQQVAFPHPLTQKDGRCELPSLDSDESLHSSVHTVFKSQCML